MADRENRPGIIIRSILFFVLYNAMGIVHSLLSLLAAPFQTFEQRYRFVNHWTRATMWLLRVLNGVHIRVEGMENLPRDEAVVVMANHQSQWETFYLQLLVTPRPRCSNGNSSGCPSSVGVWPCCNPSPSTGAPRDRP